MLSYPIDFFLFIKNLHSDSREMAPQMKNIYFQIPIATLPPSADYSRRNSQKFNMPSLVNQTVVPVSHLVFVNWLKQVPS